jgi:long-chain acyl-CoA synthetase
VTRTGLAGDILGGTRASAALIDHDRVVSYGELAALCHSRAAELGKTLPRGAIVALHGDFTEVGIVDFLALLELSCVVVPISPLATTQSGELIRASRAQFALRAGDRCPHPLGGSGSHVLYEALRERGAAGLVLFSSGTTGRPKGTVHDLTRLIGAIPNSPMDEIVVAFLLYDHIGGVSTLLQILIGGGALALPVDRSPSQIAATIERGRATVLPASPSFLAMLLSSGAADEFDVSSLRTISYGSEVMSPALLARLAEAFPRVRLRQLYGMSEVGIIRSSSESDDSTWLRLGGGSCDVRVVDGLLEIRTPAMMLGYLDDPAPFTADGWLRTNDRVEVRGDLYRVLGRDSDVINVGGVKVWPQEIETALLAFDWVADCVVMGRPHPVSGQTVAVRLVLTADAKTMPAADVRSALRRGLSGNLDPYKIPTHVALLSHDELLGERQKKKRTDA